MNDHRDISRRLKGILFWIIILIHLTGRLLAKDHDIHQIVFIGHSEVLDFEQPVKRVAIADPEIADATVISPSQILVVGKSIGTTSMIVWSQGIEYIKYKLIIQKESSPQQVMLQVRFMEVNRSALSAFGMDFILKEIGVGDQSVDVGSYG